MTDSKTNEVVEATSDGLAERLDPRTGDPCRYSKAGGGIHPNNVRCPVCDKWPRIERPEPAALSPPSAPGDVEALVEKLTDEAWRWGHGCETDGIPNRETIGDSYNEGGRDDTGPHPRGARKDARRTRRRPIRQRRRGRGA
jgi:hypothetical protein